MDKEIVKRIFSSFILIPLTFFIIIKGSFFFIFFLILVFLLACYEWYSMTKNKKYHLHGYIFLIISIFCTLKIRIDFENDYLLFLIVTITCILTDIGGFVFGKIFKGPKLIKYSPNKTYSGLIGSFVFAFIFIPFLIFYKIVDINNLLNLSIFIFTISLSSQLGDIVISFFKREANLKDTGKIIPGHGGLLDRIDGMLFAFPISYTIISTNLIKFL